jgi:hypothetical protein
VLVAGVGVKLADANGFSNALVVGLVTDAIVADDLPVNCLHAGVFTATTGEWDVVTGQTGGLTPAATYYLSLIGGGLTTVPPNVENQVVASLGVALSATVLILNILTPVEV